MWRRVHSTGVSSINVHMGQAGPPDNFGQFWTVAVLLIVFIFANPSIASRAPPPRSFDKERLISREDKIALDKVVSVISPNATKGWQKHLFGDQIFLMRYLRANNMNVEAAVRNIYKFMGFAREQHLDTILEEDWSEMSKDYPYRTDVVDRQGRPVGYMSLGEGWNIRRGILQGMREKINRYMYKVTFEISMKLLEIHKRKPNVTQIVILMNLDGFNPMEHSCPLCIQTYLNIVEIYEKLLPGFAYEVIWINAGPSWNILFQLIRPIVSTQTRKTLKIFDTNRRKWKAYLDSRIAPDQLPWEFGGTKRKA